MGHPKLHPNVTASAPAGLETYHGPHAQVQSPNLGDGALLWKHCLCPAALHAPCTALELSTLFPGERTGQCHHGSLSISSILHGSAFMADWEGDFQFLFSLGN